MAKQFSVFNFL